MSRLIASMAAASGLRDHEVRKLIVTAPRRYKVYEIAKRSGGRREIAQPTPEIKFLQRVFTEMYLLELPIHTAATAYRKGLSTVDNARPHAKNGPILKMDLKDFFPSIRGRDWVSYCERHAIFTSAEDVRLSEQLLFFRPLGGRLLRLAIGAPSSPMISNIMMFEFDTLVSEYVSNDHVTYTRYADDLTFSAPRTGHLVNVKRDVARVVRSIGFPKLDINNDKTTYVTKKYHRTVTGLTLSNDGRVTLGRDQKRNISAAVHRACTKTLADTDLHKLSGLISYAHSVEPSFVEWLANKYGHDTVEIIRRFGGGKT